MLKYVILLFLSVSITFADPVGIIQKVTQPSYTKTSADTVFQEVEAQDTIGYGDSLKTGISGVMEVLLYADSSMLKITGTSIMQLTTPERDIMRGVNMLYGDLWVKIVNTVDGFLVRTPSSTAVVMGTKFWVFTSPGGDTRLVCQEGLIDFSNNISGQSMFVSTGQMCYSTMDGSMTISEVVPEVPLQPEIQPEVESGKEVVQTPQVGPGGPPPSESITSGKEGFGLSMNGAVGAASLNGEIYQYFSIRPDISFGKFGIGLDIPFYYDSNGNLREEDWDEAGDIVDKIYYLRYGSPGENFYIRGGSLSPITLGYGLIMRRYTNAIEWPQVRRIGLQTNLKVNNFEFAGLLNNFNELDEPGLIGGRLSYELDIPFLPLVFGGTLVYDGNQYLGARDSDNDGVPDNWDMFPGKNDSDHIAWLNTLDPGTIAELIQSGDLPNIYDTAPNISDLDEDIVEWGVDIGFPLYRNEQLSLWTYAQMAQIVDFGKGYTVPGFRFNMGPFHAGLEYRIFEKQFTGEFFDMSYETERVIWDEVSDDYVTKKQIVQNYSNATGYYAEAGVNLFKLIDLFVSYQDMSYDGAENLNSVYGSASLKTSAIPRITLVEAYYFQPEFNDSFSTDANGTIIGYKVGLGLGRGISLIYDNKTVYYNGEPNHIMSIETAFTF